MPQYKTSQWLPINRKDAWNFFSSPKNLAIITPPEMDFKIISDITEDDIYEGMIIDYTVKPLLGIPVKWKTEINSVKKEKLFTDRQLKGPYKLWEHTHYFTEKDGGVLMTDEVNYILPFGFLGHIAHKLLVRKKIENIFNFRKETLNKLFSEK